MVGGLRVLDCFAFSNSVSFSQKKVGTCQSPSFLGLHSINATTELDQEINSYFSYQRFRHINYAPFLLY